MIIINVLHCIIGQIMLNKIMFSHIYFLLQLETNNLKHKLSNLLLLEKPKNSSEQISLMYFVGPIYCPYLKNENVAL